MNDAPVPLKPTERADRLASSLGVVAMTTADAAMLVGEVQGSLTTWAYVLFAASAVFLLAAVCRLWSLRSREAGLFGPLAVSLLQPILAGRPFRIRLARIARRAIVLDRVQVSLVRVMTMSRVEYVEGGAWTTYESTRDLWSTAASCLDRASCAAEDSLCGEVELLVREEDQLACQVPDHVDASENEERKLEWQVRVETILASGYVSRAAFRLPPELGPAW